MIATSTGRPIGRREFVGLMAMVSALTAFSIDAMLPGLGKIAAELSPDAPNLAQLVVTSFVLGLGLGTFFVGPLSDTYGRKVVIITGCVLYVVTAFIAFLAPSMTTMLISRFVMGVAAAAPRIVSIALIRDKHSGPEMARISSLVMMIFGIIPAFAPMAGAALMDTFGWRSIFAFFGLFGAFVMFWMLFRQPETLVESNRRTLKVSELKWAVKEVLKAPAARQVIYVLTLVYAILMATLSSTQQIYAEAFGAADTFEYFFGAAAAIAACASFMNSRLVMRFGMKRIIQIALCVMASLAAIVTVVEMSSAPQVIRLAMFFVFSAAVFATIGLTLGNLNALALEPLGHVAGMGTSVVMSLSTSLSLLLAIPVGQFFNGTPIPLTVGVFIFAAAAFALSFGLKRRTL